MIKKKILPRQKQLLGRNATRLDFYKIFWIFVFGGFFGYLYEGCLSFFGRNQSWSGNTGVIYIAFNQIYGFGAAIMIIVLYQFKNQPTWLIFLVSALLGGAYEFIASYFQELVWGYTSWNYDYLSFNIAGRTTIPFMLLWGAAGLFLIKIVYPLFHHFWHRLSPATIRFFTAATLFILALDFTVSSLAVYRMQERAQHQPALSPWQRFLDQQYPDARLSRIYPHLQPARTSRRKK